MTEEVDDHILRIRACPDYPFAALYRLLGITAVDVFVHPVEHLLNIHPDVAGPYILRFTSLEILGRLAVEVANVLRGRNKPTYTPHLDTGDHVIVINAEKVKLTGAKNEKKIYQDYSGWMGGLKEQTASVIREKHPDRLVTQAVWGMIPHNRLGRQVMTKLKVYAGKDHKHDAQQPEVLEVNA